MDPWTQKDVEHLLDDQMANIRRTYEEAIKVDGGETRSNRSGPCPRSRTG
jgi:hypothetical protein